VFRREPGPAARGRAQQFEPFGETAGKPPRQFVAPSGVAMEVARPIWRAIAVSGTD
jgi:hypothetical protein